MGSLHRTEQCPAHQLSKNDSPTRSGRPCLWMSARSTPRRCVKLAQKRRRSLAQRQRAPTNSPTMCGRPCPMRKRRLISSRRRPPSLGSPGLPPATVCPTRSGRPCLWRSARSTPGRSVRPGKPPTKPLMLPGIGLHPPVVLVIIVGTQIRNVEYSAFRCSVGRCWCEIDSWLLVRGGLLISVILVPHEVIGNIHCCYVDESRGGMGWQFLDDRNARGS